MADFPGVNGKSFTVSSLQMSIGGDTLVLRSVSPGGREVEQQHVFQVGSRVPQAVITGVEKPKEINVVIDPVSFSAWNRSKDAIAIQRPTITIVFFEEGMPSTTLDYEECGYMGEELPELKAGETTEFNVPTKWLPTRMKYDDKMTTTTRSL